jgi:magnesium-transporting ATPase (P-type)
MSVVYRNLSLNSFVKGSPDVIIDLCSFIKTEKGVIPFTSREKLKMKKLYNEMSEEALRVLAFAYKDLRDVEKKFGTDGFAFHKALQSEAEKNLVWVGMMAMIDPPRKDVGMAVAECRKFGIKSIMITGDYELTAKAIAKNVGLIGDDGTYEIINGKTLNILKDAEIYNKIKKQDIVFARIIPEQKLRIATILKNNGEVIAMTGDGVNDAPALKKADIGVAMGIMGTDVSKEAADMILLDDNFASIVSGIKKGSTIYQNLQKFVHYVFTSNASELFTVVLGIIFHIPAPVSAIQILAVDLGTDIFPSFSLGLEPEEPNALKNLTNSESRKRKGGILGKKELMRIVYLGIIMAVGAVITFVWSMLRGGWHFGQALDSVNEILYVKSTTAAYAVLAMSQMANLLQSRSEKLSPFQLGFFKNIYALGSIFISVGMFLSFMYLPFFQKYLHMLPIDKFDWLIVAITTLAVFLWEEMRKKCLTN